MTLDRQHASAYDHEDLARARWRVGRSLGRTVYAMVGDEASKEDVLLGMVDTRELAALVVATHNAALGLPMTITGR